MKEEGNIERGRKGKREEEREEKRREGEREGGEKETRTDLVP